MSAEVLLLTALMFFVLVGIHEWGHYYFAKRAGILVREFAIGFGPKVFSYKKGETRYTFRLFPIGGFVRMAGEDPEIVQVNPGQTVAVRVRDERVDRLYLDQIDERAGAIVGTVETIDLERDLKLTLDMDGERQTFAVDPSAYMVTRGKETQIAPLDRQFGSKTVGQRALSIFAGPMMNFILAFALFFAYVYMTGVPDGSPTHTEISHVEANSPADEGGLREHDKIVEVDGVRIGTDNDKLIEMIRQSPDRTMSWIVERGGEQVTLSVTPQLLENRGNVGIGIVTPVPTRAPQVGEAFDYTFETMGVATKQIFVGLQKLVTLQFKLDDLGGPVRTTQYTAEAIERGYDTYIFWAAVLSLYLGIFNLLPFPALDGSRLVFLGFEFVRGKPVDPNRESLVHFIGFALLMLLMIAVTYNDILRLFKSS